MTDTDTYVRGIMQWPKWEAEGIIDGKFHRMVGLALNTIPQSIEEDVRTGVITFGQSQYISQNPYVILWDDGEMQYFKTWKEFDEVWQAELEILWAECVESPVLH